MQTVAVGGRPKGGPECDLPSEKGFLLLGSIEFQIEKHLMSHGTRIDPETRFFMARVRDAAGDAATKMLGEARNRLETAPAAGNPDGADANAPGGEPSEASVLPAEGDPLETGSSSGCRRRAMVRTVGTAGLGTAATALVAALLITGWAPSDARTNSAARSNTSGVEEPLVVVAASEAVAAGDEKTAPVGGASISSIAGPARSEMRASDPRLRAEVGSEWDVAPYRRVAEALATALHTRKPGEQPPYPDPRAGPEQAAPTAEQATMAEQRLALTAGVRREVQRRLALARFDPQHFDGIFGPATRAALGEWQSAAGIPATGYLNASALALLRDQTADDYRAMQAANKARARQQARRTMVTSPIPQVSPVRADGCSRTSTGEIVYGRGVRCDFRGLRQSIARLFG